MDRIKRVLIDSAVHWWIFTYLMMNVSWIAIHNLLGSTYLATVRLSTITSYIIMLFNAYRQKDDEDFSLHGVRFDIAALIGAVFIFFVLVAVGDLRATIGIVLTIATFILRIKSPAARAALDSHPVLFRYSLLGTIILSLYLS